MVLAKLAAPALADALSPIPIIVAIVLLHQNDRPRASSIAYLVGRATALTALALVLRGAPRLNDAVHRPLPQWTDWILVIVGVVFIVLGMRTWWRRAKTSDKPARYSQIGGIPVPVSAAIGLFPPPANPKVSLPASLPKVRSPP